MYTLSMKMSQRLTGMYIMFSYTKAKKMKVIKLHTDKTSYPVHHLEATGKETVVPFNKYSILFLQARR